MTPTILTMAIIATALALAACGENPGSGFDQGLLMLAEVQRTSADRCVVIITPRFGGPAHTARLDGCQP